jgi:WD40 repeat protein
MIDEIYRCKIVISDSEEIDSNIQFGHLSWSPKNILCLSVHNIQQHNHSHILLINPNTPNNYTKILTDHTCPAHVFDWSLITCGNMLLSADEQDTITIWKCNKNCVNDYTLSSRFFMEGVLCSKWIHSERRFLEAKEDQTADTFSSRYIAAATRLDAVPTGSRSFLCICKNGQVHFCFMDMARKQWVSSSIHLNLEEIAVADFVTLADGKILIACSGSNKFSVHMFQCSLKKISPVTETGMPIARIQLILEEHTVFTIPMHESLYDYVDAGIKRLIILPFKSNSQELIIVCNNNQIQKWKCSPSSVYISNVLNAVSSTQDGLPVQQNIQDNDTLNNITPIERPTWCQMNTVIFEENEEITSLVCSDDSHCCYVGFKNGRIRQYSLSDLTLVAESSIPKKNEENEPLSKKAKTNHHNAPDGIAIQSIAISPNHTCIATIDSSHVLHVYSVYFQNRNEPNSKSLQRIRQRFELSVLNNFDMWDIFVLFCKHMPHELIEEFIVLWDKNKPKVNEKRFHQPNIVLGAMVGGQRLQLILRNQILLMTQPVYTILKTCLPQISSSDDNDAQTILKIYEETVLSKFNTDNMLKNNLTSLIPLINWSSHLIIFLFKDIEEYVASSSKLEARKSPINIYIMSNIRVPNFTATLREISKYSYAIASLYFNSDIKPSHDTTPPLYNLKQLEALYLFMNDVSKLSRRLQTTQQKETENAAPPSADLGSSLKDLVNIYSSQLSSLCHYDRIQLIQELDLIPQVTGVLANDYLQEESNFKSTHHKLIKRIDIVTKQQIFPQSTNYRVCKHCSRITSIDLKGWAAKWNNACIICASPYVVNVGMS